MATTSFEIEPDSATHFLEFEQHFNAVPTFHQCGKVLRDADLPRICPECDATVCSSCRGCACKTEYLQT